jgi:hypothetical protein
MLGATTLSIIALSIMTISTISYSQHGDTRNKYCADCWIFIVILRIMQSVIRLSVIMLSVILLNGVAPII